VKAVSTTNPAAPRQHRQKHSTRLFTTGFVEVVDAFPDVSAIGQSSGIKNTLAYRFSFKIFIFSYFLNEK